MLQQLKKLVNPFRPVTHALGMEITDSSIKIVDMTSGNESYRLNSYQSEPLPYKAVDDGRIEDPASVIRAIQTMRLRLDTRTRNVHMVLPSQLIMVRFLKFPDIPMKDLRRLVDFEIKHHIHLPFDQPVYDFIKLNGSEKPAKKMKSQAKKEETLNEEAFHQAAAARQEGFGLGGVDTLFGDAAGVQEANPEEKQQCDVMLVAAPQELVESYMQVAQGAGLKVVSLEIKALSLYRIIEKTDIIDPLQTLLVVDLGSTSSDVSIFHAGQLKITRNVPSSFALDQRQSVQEPSNADLLFAEFMNPDAEFLNACGDLAHELERLMNFYRYTLNHRDQEFHSVIVAGDVPRLQEISAVLEQRLSLRMVPFYTKRIEAVSPSLEELFPSYAVPIGLAMRGDTS